MAREQKSAEKSLNRGGFTLLEVMVSLAIVAGLLVTLISSLNYHLGIAGRHEFVTVASMLAREKLRESAGRAAAGKGDFPEPHADYSFTTEARETEYPGIALLTVTVSRGDERVTFSEMVQRAR